MFARKLFDTLIRDIHDVMFIRKYPKLDWVFAATPGQFLVLAYKTLRHQYHEFKNYVRHFFLNL